MRTNLLYVEVGIAILCVLIGIVMWSIPYNLDIAVFLLKAGPIYLGITLLRLFLNNKKAARKL